MKKTHASHYVDELRKRLTPMPNLGPNVTPQMPKPFADPKQVETKGMNINSPESMGQRGQEDMHDA